MATQAEPTATPQTGGICDRTPAVQDAILAALDQTPCSEVTDDDLATVKALSLETDSVSAADVASLTDITDIDLKLTDGLDAHLTSLTTLRNSHITFHLPQTEIPSAITEQFSARYNIPNDFLPHQHQDEYGRPIPTTPQSTRFDNLRFTILPTWYPGYANYRGNAPEGRGNRISVHSTTLVHHLIGSNWAATNAHITERPWWDYPKWQSVPSLK